MIPIHEISYDARFQNKGEIEMERRIVFHDEETARRFEEDYQKLVDKYAKEDETKYGGNQLETLNQRSLELIKNIPVPKEVEDGIGSMTHFMIDALHDITIKSYKAGYIKGMQDTLKAQRNQ